jgi:hypothetical protein
MKTGPAKKTALIVFMLSLSIGPAAHSKISEKKLKNRMSIFLEQIIEENSDQENRIRKFMGGSVMDGRRGIRLLDKFGLFADKLEKEGIDIQRIRFFGHENRFCIFFVMKDGKDDQLYTMFVEYEYGDKERCVLKDIYFSIVFEERMKELRAFFEAR